MDDPHAAHHRIPGMAEGLRITVTAAQDSWPSDIFQELFPLLYGTSIEYVCIVQKDAFMWMYIIYVYICLFLCMCKCRISLHCPTYYPNDSSWLMHCYFFLGGAELKHVKITQQHEGLVHGAPVLGLWWWMMMMMIVDVAKDAAARWKDLPPENFKRWVCQKGRIPRYTMIYPQINLNGNFSREK